MAIEDEEKLTLSRRVATTWVVISLAVAVLIGVVGLGMTAAGEFDLWRAPHLRQLSFRSQIFSVNMV